MFDSVVKKVIAGAAGVAMLAGAVVGGSRLAVDTAGAPVSLSQAQELKADGTTLLVQALTWWPSCGKPTSQPSTRVDSLRNADSAGLDIAGYLLLDTQSSGAEAVDRARQGIPDDLWAKLKFVAIDFEIPGECWSSGTVIPYQTISDALDELERLGKPRVLYTSYGEWTGHLVPGNPPAPPRTYLWEASWDGQPDVDFDRHPFGGWTAQDVVLEQYSGNTVRSGVYVDLDAMSAERFPWEDVPVADAGCATGTYEWSPGECASWNGGAWVSPLRVFVPNACLWFDRTTGLLTAACLPPQAAAAP